MKRSIRIFGTLLCLLLCAGALCACTAPEDKPAPPQASDSAAAAEKAVDPRLECTALIIDSTDTVLLSDLQFYPKLETLTVKDAELADITPIAACGSLKTLDLREAAITAEQYDALAAKLPACEILWSVPIGDGSFENTAESLVLPACGAEELEKLAYFPALTAADLSACEDDAAVFEFCKIHPELVCIRAVTLCGVRYPADTTEFDLTEAGITDPAELEGLRYFDSPVTVDLMGEPRTLAELRAFREAWPDTIFLVTFTLDELTDGMEPVDSFTEKLDLSERTLADPEILKEYLSFMPMLKELLMLDCSYSNEQLGDLREAFPEISIVWMLRFRGQYKLRTDAIAFSTLATNGSYAHLVDEDCEIFRYCTNLLALDLGEHYITDISFLEALPDLRVLILALNNITDISPIANLKELRYLEIFGNPKVTTYEALNGLTKLEDLNISYLDKATDYEQLYGLKSLQRLWMQRCTITREELNALKEQLPDCEIKCTANGFACGDGWRVSDKYEALKKIFRENYLDAIFNSGVEVRADES